MQKAEKLLQNLMPMEAIRKQINDIQTQFKTRDEEVIRKYKQEFNIEVDKVRKKNGFYIIVANKKEMQFPEENTKVFLEAAWELQKNKSICLNRQKNLYQRWLTRSREALEEVVKEYRSFAEHVRILYYQKNKQVNDLTATLKDLSTRFTEMESKYNLLSQKKVEIAVENKQDARLSGIGVIPFICERIDLSFQQKLMELNFGERQLAALKQRKNDVLGKFDYAMALMRRKQIEKDRLDAESDIQIELYKSQIQKYKRAAEQAIKQSNKSTQLFLAAKLVMSKQVDFIYEEKKRHKDKNTEIAERTRTIKKKDGDISRLKGIIEQMKKKAEKSLGQKVDEMVARANAAKEAEALLLKEIQLKAREEALLKLQQSLGVPLAIMKQEDASITEENSPQKEEASSKQQEDSPKQEEEPPKKVQGAPNKVEVPPKKEDAAQQKS